MSSGVIIDYPLAGALLAELLIQKRIEIDSVKPKKKLVNLIDSTPFGDPLLDEALDKIKEANRRASLKTWLTRLARIKKFKHRIADQLCRRGIVRADEDKILFLFKRRIYPEVNPVPERELVARIREAIFSDMAEVDPRTTVIVSLAYHAKVLRNDFDKKKLKPRKKRIKQIIDGEVTGQATKEAIDAINAAVMVAVIMPAIAASAASGN
jgi:hypothetical protein